jgi:predicted permease
MLFRFGTQAPLERLLDPAVLSTYFTGAVLMVGIAMGVSKKIGYGWNNASFGALVAAFPNTGFMGIPLLYELLGSASASTAIVTITIDMIFTTSLCIALSRIEGAGIHGTRVALGKALKGMLVNPMPWAIGLGVVFCNFELSFWTPIDKTVKLLSQSATPAALFTVGAVLARSWMRARASAQSNSTPKSHSPQMHDYWAITFLKLVIHPLLIFTLGQCFIHLGWSLEPFALKVMVLVAALPSASNVVMLAQRYQADDERIAKIILITTALAFITFSLAVTFYDQWF